MKISRRTSLGALIGGIFAGPSAAKSLQEGYKPWSTAGIKSDYMAKLQEKDCDTPISSELYNQQKTAELRKQINGEFNSWQQNELKSMELYVDNSENLKSISESYKTIMKRDQQIEHNKKRWIRQAKEQLEYFIKTGTWL